jgi:hypothetical protein
METALFSLLLTAMFAAAADRLRGSVHATTASSLSRC